MEIGALSGLSNAGKVTSDIGIAMLSKSLDTLEDTGEDMVKMMERSVYPNLGQNIDATV